MDANMLDPILHDRDCLETATVLCSLEEGDEVLFNRLQEVCGLPAINLETAVATLHYRNYVSVFTGVRDGQDGRWVTATASGRTKFRAFMADLASILRGASKPIVTAPSPIGIDSA